MGSDGVAVVVEWVVAVMVSSGCEIGVGLVVTESKLSSGRIQKKEKRKNEAQGRAQFHHQATQLLSHWTHRVSRSCLLVPCIFFSSGIA